MTKKIAKGKIQFFCSTANFGEVDPGLQYWMSMIYAGQTHASWFPEKKRRAIMFIFNAKKLI
jgi:hypothetical protein